MNELSELALAISNGAGVVGVVVLMGWLIVRGHLIPGKWHREAIAQARESVSKAEERADRWESVALRALDATEKLAQPVAVSARVLTQLPNPSRTEAENEAP